MGRHSRVVGKLAHMQTAKLQASLRTPARASDRAILLEGLLVAVTSSGP